MLEELLMRVKEIRVQEVDREYFIWLDDTLLALTPDQAQKLTDDLNEAIRARWRPAEMKKKPAR